MEKINAQDLNKHLEFLVNKIGPRPVGSLNNQRAQAYIADVFRSNKLLVSEPAFDCIDWHGSKVTLTIDSTKINACISPLSVPCDIRTEMILAENISELENKNFENKIVVLSGELSKEALMPKNFVFYNPENHQKIIKFLENKKPSGIVTIAHDDKAVFPIIEDGDFCIPSAYVSKSEGEKIISHINYEAALKIVSERKESQGANVIGLKQGKNKQKIVVCAHFDTKPTTPGAIDNASGTAVLLRIAELMRDKKIDNNLEFVAFNGEDYYSVPGQMQYLNDNVMENIALVINVDGVGIKNRKIGVAYINIEESRREKFLELHHEYKNIRQIEPWVQGDHSMFTMQGIPALAITSEDIFDLLESIIHSPEDTFDKVDHNLIEETARFVIDILLQIEKSL